MVHPRRKGFYKPESDLSRIVSFTPYTIAFFFLRERLRASGGKDNQKNISFGFIKTICSGMVSYTITRLATRFLTLQGDIFHVLSSPWRSSKKWTKFGEHILWPIRKPIFKSKSTESTVFSRNYEISKILAKEI